MALTKLKTSGIADDAVTTDKLANAINTARDANTAKASITINNNADNRVMTGSGTANTLNGESTVVVDASGNLGIGTSGPVGRLHVHNSGTGAGDHAYAYFTTGDTGATATDGLTIGVAATQIASINYREAGTLSFGTSSTERTYRFVWKSINRNYYGRSGYSR